MFNSFSKNLEATTICQSSGICTLDPITSALDALILQEVKEITFYLVKAREFCYDDKDSTDKLIKVLCINFLDSNISEKDYVSLYEKLLRGKDSVRNAYKKLCKTNANACEILTPAFKSKPQKLTLINLIIEGQKILTVKNKFVAQDTVKLFELIILLSKWTSTNIEKIKELEPDFDKYDFEVLRFFNIINFLATRKEKLKRRIDEFLKISYEIQKKLDQVLIENYGEKTSREVLLSTKPGKSILVGGDNLMELDLLLDNIGDRNINVYTYDVLFVAHFYSKFQKYKNLIGHVKYSDIYYDFGNFQGSILITKYSTQRLDNIYKGFIYTSTFFAPRGITKINDEKEFENLIEKTLLNEGYSEEAQEKTVFMRYNKKEIEDIIEKTAEKELVIFMDKDDKEDLLKFAQNKEIIYIDSPLEFELLFYAVELAKAKGLKTTVIFTMCKAKTVNIALCLKSQDVSTIYLNKCPKSYITPRISDCLEENFDIITIN